MTVNNIGIPMWKEPTGEGLINERNAPNETSTEEGMIFPGGHEKLGASSILTSFRSTQKELAGIVTRAKGI